MTLVLALNILWSDPSLKRIKQVRNYIAHINVSLCEKSYPEASAISQLSDLLIQLNENKQLLTVYSEFIEFYKTNQDIDSLRKAFQKVNQTFNSIHCSDMVDQLYKSSKLKVIMFSTSMSCECTLEMCNRQEAVIQKLYKENPYLFDYAVVDCYTNSDIQSKYDIGFIPTIIIFDNDNNEVKRFIREKESILIVDCILK